MVCCQFNKFVISAVPRHPFNFSILYYNRLLFKHKKTFFINGILIAILQTDHLHRGVNPVFEPGV